VRMRNIVIGTCSKCYKNILREGGGSKCYKKMVREGGGHVQLASTIE
jgi:hypothetical protein